MLFRYRKLELNTNGEWGWLSLSLWRRCLWKATRSCHSLHPPQRPRRLFLLGTRTAFSCFVLQRVFAEPEGSGTMWRAARTPSGFIFVSLCRAEEPTMMPGSPPLCHLVCTMPTLQSARKQLPHRRASLSVEDSAKGKEGGKSMIVK